ILASRLRSLYVGVTGNLHKRMIEHRQGLVPGFTSRYRIFRLVHLESFGDVHAAIAREKEIKGWRREKKILADRTRQSYVGRFEPSGRAWANARSGRTADPSPPSAKGAAGFGMTTFEANQVRGSKRTADPSPPSGKERRPGSG